MKKALITGIGGFVGSHLTDYLLSQKVKVDGFIHPKHLKSQRLLKNKDVKLISCDLLEDKEVLARLSGANYDYIFHLAAFSSPAESFKNPQETLTNNIFGQLNLLQALVRLKSKAKILVVGSSEEYGSPAKKYLPIKESTPLEPSSPYAVSKVAQDLLGYQFFLNHGLRVIRVRPFNHIGPGQSTSFVVPAFASQIARLEKNGGGQIKVGNLQSFRDFTDVRDIVRAYFAILEKGETGEVYNVGSGTTHKIADILKKLISLSKIKVDVVVDKRLFRPTDVEKIYCDFSKLNLQTGWKPKISIAKSLSDTIKYERQKIS